MKRWILSVSSVVLGIISAIHIQGLAQNPPDKKLLDQFMQMKLEHSKRIMEGLATEDFELIAKEAQELKALSLESSWNVHTTQPYLEQSADFRRSIDLITEAAHEENVDRAALGYMSLTVRCIECHRYLRKHHSQ